MQAWLNPRDVPTIESLQCGVCSQPLRFVLQVYAAGDHDSAYHRMLYVFCCGRGACLRAHPSKALRCLRSQLPRRNPFYAYEPVKKDPKAPLEEDKPYPNGRCRSGGRGREDLALT
jgi:pre-rRNA-processing protein TSR4